MSKLKLACKYLSHVISANCTVDDSLPCYLAFWRFLTLYYVSFILTASEIVGSLLVAHTHESGLVPHPTVLLPDLILQSACSSLHLLSVQMQVLVSDLAALFSRNDLALSRL